MTPTLSTHPDYDKLRAARRPRSALPSMPWVELLGFLIMIALTLSSGS